MRRKRREEGAEDRDLSKHLVNRVNFLPKHYFPMSWLGNKEQKREIHTQ